MISEDISTGYEVRLPVVKTEKYAQRVIQTILVIGYDEEGSPVLGDSFCVDAICFFVIYMIVDEAQVRFENAIYQARPFHFFIHSLHSIGHK